MLNGLAPGKKCKRPKDEKSVVVVCGWDEIWARSRRVKESRMGRKWINMIVELRNLY